ncbi:MAG: hypothetical protein LBS56_07840, partial [Propionibacteriaceae bacterium]|nr:hypothetical protein [Propionibacteriaceae bacterium]
MRYDDDSVTTVAQASESGHEIVLRRRLHAGVAVDELIINGVFAMDSASTDSELALAESLGADPGRVLVGGLGLGYTARRLLDLGAAALDIVEISPALIDWALQGLVQPAGALAHDPRVSLHRGDVAELLTHQPTLPGLFGPWDAICLDIDNGPSFLIHPDNARLYTREGVRSALSHVVVGGRLSLWSQGPSK